MMDLISSLLDSVLDPIRAAVARMARSAAELAIVGVFALTGTGFLVAALVIWLSSVVGPLYATLIMAGVSFVVMAIVLAIWMSSTAADRRKAEEEARRKAEAKKRQPMGGASMWRTAMNLAPLVSLVAKRSRRPKRAPEARVEAVAARAGRRGEAVSDRLTSEARHAAALAAEGAHTAARVSRKAIRGSMQGVGPWIVMAAAIAGGALASRAVRRR